MLKVSVEDIGPPLGRVAFAKYLCALSLSLSLAFRLMIRQIGPLCLFL